MIDTKGQKLFEIIKKQFAVGLMFLETLFLYTE